MWLSCLVGVPMITNPHAFGGASWLPMTLLAMKVAALLYCVGLIVYVTPAGVVGPCTNGALKVRCTPPLHAGDAKAVQSPAIIAGVGINDCVFAASDRRVVPWYPPKKNSLFFV